MSYRPPPPVFWTGILSIVVGCSGAPSSSYSTDEIEAAKAELREHVRLRTFESGAAVGEEWVARAPDDAEIRALYARQLLAWRTFKEIRRQAEAILSEDPDDPWGLYTEALAILADDDWHLAAEPSLRAWRTNPRPEFAAAHIQALRFKSAEEALGFLATLDSATRADPEVMHVQAEVEYQAQYELSDPTLADTSLATLAELRERWPDHVDGYLRAAEHLFRANRAAEALPLIERAVALAPGSADVRQWHWWILWESNALPTEERRPAVEASIAEFEQAAPESIRGLSVIAAIYRDMNDDERAEAIEARVVELDPLSRHATLIYGREYGTERSKLNRLYRAEGSDSPEYRAQLVKVRDAVNRYLERPLYDDKYKSSAYITLFTTLDAMDPVPAEELAEAVRGLAEHERLNPHITYGMAPISMADHTPYAAEAAAIAESGLEAAVRRAEMSRSSYQTEGEWEQSLRYYLSLVYDAMGWGYFKSGRVDDGRYVIQSALQLEDQNRDANYHLGQVFEHKATEAEAVDDEEAAIEWLDQAEDAYIAGLGSTRVGDNPSQAAIEALYERRTGSRDGIEEYLATLDERDQIRRRDRILETRLESGGTYEAFQLARLGGDVFDSGELDGVISVLHFWGTWCGPCIVEMPEYQKFDARYRDDPNVRVLSISNDNSREVVEEYMTRNEFDFAVLFDEGYVQRAGISAWPTTWFIDANGFIQFVKRGNTSKLDEEFTWRVEAIRAAGGPS